MQKRLIAYLFRGEELFERIYRGDAEKVLENTKTIWEQQKSEFPSAFVVYDENGEYFDSVDPITKIAEDENYIYVMNYTSYVDGHAYNKEKLKEKGYSCVKDEAHFSYTCGTNDCEIPLFNNK